jgi:outer membrane lipoprotein carrier protein
MRKFVTAAIALFLVTGIALLVRPEVKEEASAPATRQTPAAQHVAAPQDTVTAVVDEPVPEAVVQPVTQSVRPAARPAVAPTASPAPAGSEAEVQDGATILKRAAAAYARVSSMRADFVQRRENPLLNSNMTSRGTLYQRKPDRFALKFSQPAGDVIVGDGRYFWVYYPSADKRQVIRADAGEGGAGAVDLQAQFIGDPVKRFSFTYHGTEKQGARTMHVLTLVPRQNTGYKSMKVWIDGGDSLVRRFIITEQTGATVEFQLSNVALNGKLGDEIFRFTPPAGAQVIER